MDNKTRIAILIIVVVIALATLFALAGAAVRDDESLAFLPIILYITGTPEPTNTPIPATATPTVTPTNTPTPTATPIPRHFNDCAYRTGNNGTVAVPTSVTINGSLVLAVDDEIAVFTPEGNICAGMSPWSGENIALTVWGDDSQTDEIDGLQPGEKMAFRIWDKSEDQEYLVSEVTYSVGNGLYSVDGIYVVSSFTLE